MTNERLCKARVEAINKSIGEVEFTEVCQVGARGPDEVYAVSKLQAEGYLTRTRLVNCFQGNQDNQ